LDELRPIRTEASPFGATAAEEAGGECLNGYCMSRKTLFFKFAGIFNQYLSVMFLPV